MAAAVCLVGLVLFIDATHLTGDGKTKVYPVYLSLTNTFMDLSRVHGARVLLGYMPLLGWGYTKAERQCGPFKLRQRQLLQESLELVRVEALLGPHQDAPNTVFADAGSAPHSGPRTGRHGVAGGCKRSAT